MRTTARIKVLRRRRTIKNTVKRPRIYFISFIRSLEERFKGEVEPLSERIDEVLYGEGGS